MRLPLLLILPLLLLGVLLDWYICRAVALRCKVRSRLWRNVVVWSAVALNVGLVVLIAWPKKSSSDDGLLAMMWALYAYLSVYLGKALFVVVDLVGKIPCLFHRPRLRGFDIAGLSLGALLFIGLWLGVVNTHRTAVEEVEIADPLLPVSFDGFRVAQISDLHVGSYGTDTAYLARVVEQVNELKPDVVLFTGDIVNRRSSELRPFVATLSRLIAPYGVYSILGNHDYGDYYHWPTHEAKQANMHELKEMQRQMGWTMLNDSTTVLRRDNDSIVVIGVENIGDPPFPVYGSLDDAYKGDLADPSFKILMSHNPAHWNADIRNAPDKNIALTLSGHTHAMQCELFGWSPAKWKYKTWGGLYSDEDHAHLLYVNIGIGEVAMPARIGATPEITLFILRNAARQ